MTTYTAKPSNKDYISKLADPVTFIEALLSFQGKPLRLYPYQKQIARQSNWIKQRKNIAILKARQVGGSILVAALLTYYLYVHNGIKVLCLSRTQEQSGLIYEYVRDFFETSPILSSAINYKKTVKHDLYINNSRLAQRTTGADSRNIRGLSLSSNGLLVVDEAAYVPTSAIVSILPASFGCSVILCSTPRTKHGFFYEAVTSGNFETFRIPLALCPRVSREEIDSLRRLLSASAYKNEVLAEFAQGESTVFDADAILRNIDHRLPIFEADTFGWMAEKFPFKPNPNANHCFSLDPIRGAKDDSDDTVLHIFEKTDDTLKLVAYHVWTCASNVDHANATKTDSPQQILGDIVRYLDRFKCTKAYIDITTNPYYAWELANKHLVNVEEINWSATQKERMISHADACLKADRIKIPNDPELITQLMEFAFDTKRMEDHSDRKIYLSGRDDHVAAFAQGSLALTGETIFNPTLTISTW